MEMETAQDPSRVLAERMNLPYTDLAGYTPDGKLLSLLLRIAVMQP